jgi:integrase
MDAEVTKEQIAYNTWKSHRYRLKLGLQFLETKYPKALGQRLSQIDGEKFNDYLDWRIAVTALKGKTIRRDVVRDELLTIRKMFAWAQKQKLCSARAIPNFHFIVESESPKRERIVVGSRPQYMKILGQWAMFEDVKVDINFERTRYHRMMTLHVINLVECSGMRSGEVFGLKNKNVQEIEGLNEFLIHIDKKTSKVRRDRDITVNSHIFATWFRNIRKHRDPNDFVFSPLGAGTKSCRDTFYHQYKLFRVKLKDANLEWYDLYHSRHMWVTNRLLAGEQIDKVAKAAGTSIREIEATYNHILTAQITKEFNEKEVIHFADGRREVIRVSDDDDDEMVSQVKLLMKKKVKRKASGVSRNTRKATASSVE